MAFRTKGTDPKDKAVADAQAEARQLRETVAVLRAENKALKTQTVAAEQDFLSTLLAFEESARVAAAGYPDGPNCDAMKAALRNASHGIAHVRKVLDQNRRLA